MDGAERSSVARRWIPSGSSEAVSNLCKGGFVFMGLVLPPEGCLEVFGVSWTMRPFVVEPRGVLGEEAIAAAIKESTSYGERNTLATGNFLASDVKPSERLVCVAPQHQTRACDDVRNRVPGS